MKPLVLASCALALLLAACETTDTVKPQLTVGAPATARPGLAPRERERRAVEMLNQGRPAEARTELAAALTQEPGAALALNLMRQIDTDPKVLLGEKSFSYTVRRGETFTGLADRFLGDPYLFYALARYNGVAVPAQSQVGGTLQIPGEPKRAAAPAPRKPAAAAAAAPVTATAPVAPARNPAQASQLRATALEHMSKGAIDNAITLLRKAAALDPGNLLIRRDLERALRIQATVRARA